MSQFQLLIDGKLVEGSRYTDVIDPATEQICAQAPRASHEQLNAAVQAAKRAFPAWSATALSERRAVLMRIADAVQGRAQELAPLLVREHGMPMRSAMIELMVFAMKLRGAAAQPVPVKKIDVGPGREVEQHYRPLGVVAAIVPWNVPLILLAAKLGPALLMGNTVVVKPAPTSSLTTLKIGELIAPILPPGVVNIISDEDDLGGPLSSHADVRMITFTGSTVTGRKVAHAAADTLKRFMLELGGNDPAIVFDDADPVSAAAKIFGQAFLVNGQACVAIKRVYAQSGIHDRLCEELWKLAKSTKVGNGFTEGVDYGPLQNRAQFERVRAHLEEVRSRGRIVAQGIAPPGPGYFIAPTIVADVRDGDRIVDDEQFGPILPVVRFDDVDAVIEQINAGPYGLAASVFTRDMARGRSVAMRIEAGTVTINKVLEMHPLVPFGGAKGSGIGVENCEEGLAEFAQLQIVDTAV
jgi:acyl-CoA reductase-like NAD-dependent aldehyde dehydrogenase